MRTIAFLFFTTLAGLLHAAEYHVAKSGGDGSDGSAGTPFLTIQHAADVARPSDTITVHEGVYRERVNPPRGGLSDAQRIVYQAAPGEEVVIKGSELMTGWQWVTNDTWEVSIPNEFFGEFNPYDDVIWGEFYLDLGRDHHTGSVYLNGHWLIEAATQQEVSDLYEPEGLWFAEVDASNTVIQAQFLNVNPNEEQVEINVRQSVFYPSETGRDYITVKGFTLEQAATPWAPPTAEQIGLIGTHWSKGWIIKDNTIQYSTCTGVTLGKYGDEFDNISANSATGYVPFIERALTNGWNEATVGSHWVRNNHILHCEQAGLVGSLGAIFSTITSNEVNDIHVRRLFSGWEMAGIKIHASIDMEISDNNIHDTFRGIWLDWMAQGTRVTRNLFYNNSEQDLFIEVNHGPYLVDNNLFLSPVSVADWSQGGAFVHNLFAGRLARNPQSRETPYHEAHSTEIAGLSAGIGGDNRYFNNIFHGYGLEVYDTAILPVCAAGNVFLNGAIPSTNEVNPLVATNTSAITLIPKKDGVYLHVSYDSAWGQTNRPVVTTERLGNAVIPDLPFEQPDGSPYRIGTDFYGASRDTNNLCAGPFAFSGSETNTFKLGSYAPDTVPPNVLAHWNFDDAAVDGSYADSSGNGLNIAATVAPAHITSGLIFGAGALSFTAGQYLTLADDPVDGTAALPLANNSFSVSYWAKRNATDANQLLIGMSDPTFSGSSHSDYADKALHIGFRSATATTIDFYSDGLDNPLTPVDTTTWHHYVITVDADSNQQRIVMDGNLLFSVSRTSSGDFIGDVNANITADDIKNDFWIGRTFNSFNFSGMVDEVWVFGDVLSDLEIHDLYSSSQLSAVADKSVVTLFTGGDVGEGLDLSGETVYAVNVAGAEVSLQGKTFTADASTIGFTSVSSSNYKNNWGTKPSYGATADDAALATLMNATCLAYNNGSFIDLDMAVTAGHEYKLQLLFSENALKTADARKFDIAVEGVTIVDEFTPIPAAAVWTTASHTGVLVIYQFVAGDSVINVDLTQGSSGDMNPVIQGVILKDVTPGPPELATVTSFTGGDAGEGLDWIGKTVYAVNVAGAEVSLRGKTFTADASTIGFTSTSSTPFEGNWGTKSSYGATADDAALATLMNATCLAYNNGSFIDLDMDVTAGQEYVLQLLFSENVIKTAEGRKFDIAVEGVRILDEFSPIPVEAEWTTAPNTGVLVTYQFVAGDRVINVDLTPGSSGDSNPIIQGVILKEISVYDQWAADFLPVVIGSETNDYDGDLKDNFYEYVFNGDPTNQAVTATPPVLERKGGEFRLTHVQRADDTNLLYGLEACTNLVSNAWTNFDYDVLGTNATGVEFHFVTNRFSSSVPQSFIRLKVERP